MVSPDIAIGEQYTPPFTSRTKSMYKPIGSAVKLRSTHHLDHRILTGNNDQRFGYAEFQTDDGSVNIG